MLFNVRFDITISLAKSKVVPTGEKSITRGKNPYNHCRGDRAMAKSGAGFLLAQALNSRQKWRVAAVDENLERVRGEVGKICLAEFFQT